MRWIILQRLALVLVLVCFFFCVSSCGEGKNINLNTEIQFNYQGYANKEADELKNKILSSKNTEEIYRIEGKKYYVSSNGDDSNDGLSPEKPFKTLKKIEKIDLGFGDAVLFERGSVFHMNDLIDASIETTMIINPKYGVIYGAYGEGNKPEIYASPMDYAKSEKLWIKTKENLWEADFKYQPACNIVFDNGREIGNLKHTKLIEENEYENYYFAECGELTKNGDFFHDYKKGKIYLYCDKGNPAEVYKSIEIASAVTIFEIENLRSNVTIDNLCLKYAGFAIKAIHSGENFSITNCEIGYIGGHTTKNVRYGNAIEFYGRAVNLKVENNWIYQTFDSAVTWQGSDSGKYSNISFSGNLLEYNNADFEFFERKDAVIEDFKMDNNIMRFTSLGWGTRDGIRGIEGCIRGSTQRIKNLNNASFCNNIIDCPARQVINWRMTEKQLSNTSVSNNTVHIKKSHREIYNEKAPVVSGVPDKDHKTQEYKNIEIKDNDTLTTVWSHFNRNKNDKVYWYEE